MNNVACTNCRQPYPNDGVPHHCTVCGGLFDFVSLSSFDGSQAYENLPGIWRYRKTLGLPVNAPCVSLGEGNTPLVWASVKSHNGIEFEVGFKCENLNPTGSFKDRGSATITSFLLSRDVHVALEDSSGNAGASLAAYTARVGISTQIYVPEYASGAKLAQILAYGAQVVKVPGSRSNATEAVQSALESVPAEQTAAYASHAYLPFNLPGYATLAYELFEQLGRPPGTLVVPVGQGGLLMGVSRGFHVLMNAGVISVLPVLVGVQARSCAPLWALSSYGSEGLGWVTESQTVAEGIRVRHPLRGDAVIRMVESSKGYFHAVDEEKILTGREELAKRGMYVEPTSSVVWDALLNMEGDIPQPVVAVLTGSGLKV